MVDSARDRGSSFLLSPLNEVGGFDVLVLDRSFVEGELSAPVLGMDLRDLDRAGKLEGFEVGRLADGGDVNDTGAFALASDEAVGAVSLEVE